MIHKISGALCALCLLLAVTATAFAVSFTDVNETSWYYADVTKAAEAGLVNGVGGGAFAPMGNVSRGAVITALWRLEGSPAAAGASFPDVADAAWYATAAVWAKGAGLAGGYADGTFHPEANITRQELAVFLFRYAQYTKAPIAQGVLDIYGDAAQVAAWALDGMKHAAGAGLITGDTDGNLLPAGQANRAQLAAILVRLTTPVVG